LKDCDCDEHIEKLKKEECLNPEVFWEMSEGDFKDIGEIKLFGRKKLLMNRINEMKRLHEEKMEDIHKNE